MSEFVSFMASVVLICIAIAATSYLVYGFLEHNHWKVNGPLIGISIILGDMMIGGSVLFFYIVNYPHDEEEGHPALVIGFFVFVVGIVISGL